MGVDKLICVGEAVGITADYAAKKLGRNNVYFVSHWKEALTVLRPLLNRRSVVLVKGSRRIGLDNLISQLS